MSYKYTEYKAAVFTERGQEMFLRVRDFVHNAIETAGAVRMDKAINAAGSGLNWDMMACVDRLVELKEIVEVSETDCAGQYRIFTNYD